MGLMKRLAEADYADNLPLEAIVPFRDYQALDINDYWLQSADDDDKMEAMRAWFHARFCDPAIDTPYNGREGGFLFVNGGPYDPAQVLPERFQRLVSADLIELLLDELHAVHGDRWAPIRYDGPDDYDGLFDLPHLPQDDAPLLRLSERLQHARLVLSLTGDANAISLVEKLAFGAAISALEAFLWETVSYWVEHEAQVVRNIITKLPVFRDQPMKLGQIYERHENLKAEVLSHLQNIVWHRWDQVIPLFTAGLGIEIDSTKVFTDAMVKRHDIVHRSGHDKAGNPVGIDSEEVMRLCDEIEKFAGAIKLRLSKKYEEW